MQSLLEKLENNEAVLLMYLADELPADDRAEVDSQLLNDPQLRDQLAQLRQTDQSIASQLNSSPTVPTESRQNRLVQQVTLAMIQQQARKDEHARQVADNAPARRLLRIPNWAYPIATAAMVLIAFIAYWGFTKSNDQVATTDPSPIHETASDEAIDARFVDRLEKLSIDESDRDLLAVSASGNDLSSNFQVDPQ